MSPVKAKISLTPEQATLLIPLYAKAQADNPIFFDPEARAILDQVDYDFTRLRVPYKTVVLVCQRAKKLDAITRDFLTQHPDGVVLHLGCGLDGRFRRVANPRGAWYDLDMPPVIDLRRQFYSAAAGYQMLASSVTDLRWVEAVAAAGRPVLVVAEGLLMYLSEAEVRQQPSNVVPIIGTCRVTSKRRAFMQGFNGWQAALAKVGSGAALIGLAVQTPAIAADKFQPFVAGVQISEVLVVPSPDGNCSATEAYPGLTGQGTISGTGLGSSIGAFAIASVDCVRSSTAGNFLPPFGFSSGSVTLTVAGGDRIVVSYTGTSDLSPIGLLVLKGTYTILGGTGSFQKAKGSGTLAGIEDILATPARGFITLTGHISH